MKKRVLCAIVFLWLILSIVTALAVYMARSSSNESEVRYQLVKLNQMQKIIEKADEENENAVSEELKEALTQYEQTVREGMQDSNKQGAQKIILLMYGVCVFFLLCTFGYVYYAILMPFDKMKTYAREIAKGNFDIALKYERSNYFGAFTWAFDNMRKEVMNARKREQEAIRNNKTVIATISHDIKTPITAIQAYSEGLAANIDSSTQKRASYISVILRRCEEVVKLTNDLQLHSISDLDKLKIDKKPESIKNLIQKAVQSPDIEENAIRIDENLPDCQLMLDKQRIKQVLDNIISNSRKYAKTAIDITGTMTEQEYILTIRDYGQGIPAQDMPFIFGKFYRGHNIGNEKGSGLGLFITKYIMKQHDGDIKLYSHHDGLEAILIFSKNPCT